MKQGSLTALLQNGVYLSYSFYGSTGEHTGETHNHQPVSSWTETCQGVHIDCVAVDDVVVGPPETSTHGSTRPDLDPVPCETRLPEPRLASGVQYKRRCLRVKLKYPADTFMSGVHVCLVIVWSRCVKIGQLCSAASASHFQTVLCCSFCERMREVGDPLLQVALTHLRGVFVVRSVFLLLSSVGGNS